MCPTWGRSSLEPPSHTHTGRNPRTMCHKSDPLFSALLFVIMSALLCVVTGVAAALITAHDPRCHCVPQHLCADERLENSPHAIMDIRSRAHNCEYPKHCCTKIKLFKLLNPTKRKKSTHNETASLAPSLSPSPAPAPVPKLVLSSPTPKPQHKCGITNSNEVRVLSNTFTRFGEVTWNAIIFSLNTKKELSFQCGGSIIHLQVVLTVAHCVHDWSDSVMIVRGGEWNLKSQKEAETHQDMLAREVVIHPKYNREMLHNDIALVFLVEPFKVSEGLGIICLPPPQYLPVTTPCMATGWGRTSYQGHTSSLLKKVYLSLVPNEVCEKTLQSTRLGPGFSLDESFLCAGGELNQDTCQGDGGGPLACQLQGGVWSLIGMVSWGIGCGGPIPGVYVNVGMFVEWITGEISCRNLYD